MLKENQTQKEYQISETECLNWDRNFAECKMKFHKQMNYQNSNDIVDNFNNYNTPDNIETLIFGKYQTQYDTIFAQHFKENEKILEDNKKINSKNLNVVIGNKKEERVIILDDSDDSVENEDKNEQINNISNNNNIEIKGSQEKNEKEIKNDKKLINNMNNTKNNQENKNQLNNFPINKNNNTNTKSEKNFTNQINKNQFNENTTIINNKINQNPNNSPTTIKNSGTNPPHKCAKNLFYKRELKIPSTKKFRFENTPKNVKFNLGTYSANQNLPNFIFGKKNFYYEPHNLRQIYGNYKGYFISFPDLYNRYHNAVIANDQKLIFTYYFKQKRGKQTSLDVKMRDLKTLNDGVFLNDGIVNFYLKIIEDQYFNGNSNNNILIMKSFFYNLLSNQQTQFEIFYTFTYPESCSFSVMKINVFLFKTLIIPICENYHWSLIIVNDLDKMKNIFIDDINNKEYPQLFYLDSFYERNDRRILIILKYLFFEYKKIYNCENINDMNHYFQKNHYKFKIYFPDVPKQNNNYDCGIFILMYVELFLYNPLYFLKNAARDFSILANGNTNSNSNSNLENNMNVNLSNNMSNNINNSNENKENKENNEMNNTNIIKNNGENNDISKELKKILGTDNTNEFKNEKMKTENQRDNNGNNNSNVGNNNCDNNENNNNANNDNTNIGNNNSNLLMNGDDKEMSLKNWFSQELIENYRKKIIKLIDKLSEIKKNNGNDEIKSIINKQYEIIGKYFNEQQKEFIDHFSKIEK